MYEEVNTGEHRRYIPVKLLPRFTAEVCNTFCIYVFHATTPTSSSGAMYPLLSNIDCNYVIIIYILNNIIVYRK